jgi:hypothetical protein
MLVTAVITSWTPCPRRSKEPTNRRLEWGTQHFFILLGGAARPMTPPVLMTQRERVVWAQVECRAYGARIVLGIDFTAHPRIFLWNLVALANFMRLSLLKGARAASSSAAWQENRVPRAGLNFGGRPRAPCICGDCRCHFSLNLPQASRLLGMTRLL